jgi:hypothetical protein
MKRPVLTPKVLDGLRLVGDPGLATGLPPASRDLARYQSGGQGNGGRPAMDPDVATAAERDANDYLKHVQDRYGAKPGHLILQARDLFVRYGDEISAALLLSALPESYAAAWGAPVLIAHGDLVWQLPRRIRQTALFLLAVLTDAGPNVTRRDPTAPSPPVTAAPVLRSEEPARVVNPDSTLFQQCVWLRQFHAGIRQDLSDPTSTLLQHPARNAPPSVPLNQEDLLATLLSFSVTTFRVLDAFGIAVDDADREAYVFLWNLVGACLGVGTPVVGDTLEFLARWNRDDTFADTVPKRWLLPGTVSRAGRLLDQLQARQWIGVQNTIDRARPFPWSDLAPGRTLVAALLDGLVEAMPPSRQAWPAIVMRELVPEPVQARLGLQRMGMTGLAGFALNANRSGKRIRSSALRLMANDVTRHAMQDFVQADGPSPFRIPGLDLTQVGRARRGSQYDLRTR